MNVILVFPCSVSLADFICNEEFMNAEASTRDCVLMARVSKGALMNAKDKYKALELNRLLDLQNAEASV